MQDNLLETGGDSPELEALFDSIATQNRAPAAAPAPVDIGGDSPELQALFDTVVTQTHTASVLSAPVAPAPADTSGDSDELQALFDTVAAEFSPPDDTPAAAIASPSNASAGEMYSKVGQLTRKLHDALHELGYDKSLERAASAIPDAKDRLSYIATLTENAAERALNATDRAQPHQDDLESEAQGLSQRWDKLYANQLSVEEFKALGQATRAYLSAVPAHTQATKHELMEIVMAQDFQDLTGQVIKKVVEMVQGMERELLSFLMEYQPEIRIEPDHEGLENGPVVNAAGRTDVVTNQQQVDDLLASLGF